MFVPFVVLKSVLRVATFSHISSAYNISSSDLNVIDTQGINGFKSESTCSMTRNQLSKTSLVIWNIKQLFV